MKGEISKAFGDFAPDLPRPAVVCTLVKITGSAPQQVGARMWVSRSGPVGTLGGGEFERRVLERCAELLAAAEPKPELKEFVLCREMGQCCGGRVEVFFEPVLPKRVVHLFGGGHVGRAVAHVLSQTPLAVTLVDPRPEWSSRDGLPSDVQALHADPLEYARSRRWGPGDAACIFTHSHDLDLELVRALLPEPLGYIGLIGSEHKSDVFQAKLKGRPSHHDWQELWDERMHCPIGLGLPSKNPKVIAIAVAAELLQSWGLTPGVTSQNMTVSAAP